MMSRCKEWNSLCLLVIAAVLPIGCQQAHDGKYLVTGQVTWKGAPIEEGFIQLQPKDGKSPESGKIQQGTFSVYARPGENRVSITATKVDGRDESMNQPRIVQYIPSQYNLASKLTFTVQPNNNNSYEVSLVEDESPVEKGR